MKKLPLCIVVLAAMSATGARAQDLSGNWQATLKAGQDLRVIFNFYKGDKDAWNAKMYSIDQGGQPIPVTSVTRHESSIKISVDMIGGTFEGKLSEDGKTITGTWTQGTQPLPLTLVRATPETAWDIPAPPPPLKRIPTDANPTFEVATIKPTQEGTHFSIHPTRGGELVATDASLAYLIKFAYEVHPRQITKGPAWLDTDKYDLTAKPDIEGQPSLKQMRVMVQKLLADRFQLTFHREKIELPVYAVTVAKGGPKLTMNNTNPDGNPGYGGGPAGMRVMNSTITEFIGFVLNDSLGLPVVDQTGLGSGTSAMLTLPMLFGAFPPRSPHRAAPPRSFPGAVARNDANATHPQKRTATKSARRISKTVMEPPLSPDGV
jgi:uncharacterized protein (TIGR03435 family)